MNNNDFKKKLIERSFNLSRRVLALVDRFPSKRAAWVISDQLLRAATSIGANIIEA
jgi:four helix bundle protein